MEATLPPPRRRADPAPITRLRADAPVLVVTLALFALCAAALSFKGKTYNPEMIGLNAQLYLAAIAALLVPHAAWQMWRERPDSPLRFLQARYLAASPYRTHLLGGLPILAVQISLLPFFSAMKSTIPVFHAYNWDAALIAADRALFLGHDPWRLLQPVLGFPLVTAALALCYHLWLLLNYMGCAYLLFARIDDRIRRRFFLCFTLSWSLIGGVLATLFASYGPCFLEPLGGNAHFADQMAYLRAADAQIPVMTLPVQDMLLAKFHEQANGLGSGISAMPSMHIAIAFLFYLAIRDVSKRLGRFFFGFFVVIWVASVHLAYHYAVDGLVSVVVVSLLWRLSGRLIAWWDASSAVGRVQPTLRTNTVPAE